MRRPPDHDAGAAWEAALAEAADVVVIGAGPTGLVAALRLAQAGRRVLLLEKRPGLSAASLASTIHPPTLEILDALGVLAPVRHEGQVVDRIQHRTPAGVFAEFHLHALANDTRFPFRLHLEQARITPVMLDRLRALPNAAVRFGCAATGIEQGTDGIAVLTDGGRIEAQWAIAADGARSAVRDAAGIAFDGVDYPDKILRLLTHDDLDPLLPGIAPLTYLSNGSRSVSFLRMADCWRVILRVPADTPDADVVDDAWAQGRFAAVLPGARLPAVAGRDVYRASRRVAGTFAQGRLLLAGDAAHVTSTRGGMNMNAGIHDAVALADALLAGDVLAAAAERRRVAETELIPRTDRTVSGGAAWSGSVADIARDPAAALPYLRSTAMLDMLDRSAFAHAA